MSFTRIALKTALLTAALHLAFYPSRTDLLEIGAAWLAVAVVYALAAYVTWKTQFASLGAVAGLKAAVRSWSLPDAPRAPSRKQPSRHEQVA